MPRSPINHRGFTLTELAVALVIIALLMGGLMMPLSSQQDIRNRQETEKALGEIREALIGFAVINGRLPCPATKSIASNTAGAGIESTTGSGTTLACTSTSGVLPWATLGLPETDAWGHRYTYRVSPVFARGVDPFPSISSTFGTGCSLTLTTDMPTKAAFALCTQGDLSVLTTTGGTSLASSVPAVVVSHGRNGLGAWQPTGSQIAGASGDEATNTATGTSFVSNTAIDDQLTWLPSNLLMSRMISAGKLP